MPRGGIVPKQLGSRGAKSSAGRNFRATETIESRVFGLINDTHAATTELFKDAVVGDGLPQE